MPVILAIDPGVTGAYAVLDSTITVDDIPVHVTQHGHSARSRAELDLHGFRAALLTHRHIEHAFIERVAARPGQGVTSMFRFGEASGGLYGLLVGLGVRVTFVTPKTWQKHHGIGATPDAARQRAVQLCPELDHMLSRKKDEHRADALLLGLYGRHTLNGSSPGRT